MAGDAGRGGWVDGGEASQCFARGRAVELHDVIANGAGASCGALLGLPIRNLIVLH